jgi:hypothetical protein
MHVAFCRTALCEECVSNRVKSDSIDPITDLEAILTGRQHAPETTVHVWESEGKKFFLKWNSEQCMNSKVEILDKGFH